MQLHVTVIYAMWSSQVFARHVSIAVAFVIHF